MGAWRRDGTLVLPDQVEYDLTNGSDWITIKGKSKGSGRKLADQIVELLNSEESS